jgi:iron complex transport system substrate-binding protein
MLETSPKGRSATNTRPLAVVHGIVILALLIGLVSTASARTFVDAAGRSVQIPDHVGRILAAGPPASLLVYSLAPDKLIGWVRALSDDEKAFLPPAYANLPVHGRLTGRGNTASLENVVALKPDLIVDVGTVDRTYASLADKVQEQTGIPYILLDGSLAKNGDTYRQLGALTGDQAAAASLATFSDDILDRAARLRAAAQERHPKVYYGRGPDGLETGLAGSINVELLGLIGADNVAAGAGHGGLTHVSLEQVIAWNPDTILAEDPHFLTVLENDPRWASIDAVQHHRFFLVPSKPFGWFDSPPGVNRLIGLQWLESLLYPDHEQADLRQSASDFYERFYHRRPSPSQIDELLRDAVPAR